MIGRKIGMERKGMDIGNVIGRYIGKGRLLKTKGEIRTRKRREKVSNKRGVWRVE